ncbi:hypothetical protein BGS_0157 [Beggiatoa sp. SS]|nr:hypothetical protein BGS_0157 [Beggiatoa sp. SS]
MPFAQDSLDVVVVPHILESEDIRMKFCGKWNGSLFPEGHIVILGFKPREFMGDLALVFCTARNSPVVW